MQFFCCSFCYKIRTAKWICLQFSENAHNIYQTPRDLFYGSFARYNQLPPECITEVSYVIKALKQNQQSNKLANMPNGV